MGFLLISNGKVLQAYDSLKEAEKGISFYTEDFGLGEIVIAEIVERYRRKVKYERSTARGTESDTLPGQGT